MKHVFCLGLLFLFSSISFGQLKSFNQAEQGELWTVEPPSWFIHETEQQIEILLFGQGIGLDEFLIENSEIALLQQISTESLDYVILEVNIPAKCSARSFNISKNDGGTIRTVYTFNLFSAKHSLGRIDAADLIYLITPDRFADAEPNNKVEGFEEVVNRNKPGGRHGGDILGIASHLDYIKRLGFTAVWVNPVLENNMPQHSYHGYSITNFYKVDPRFGSMATYSALARKCHSEGMKLIMDQILNHCGSEHPWVENPPFKNWFNYQGNFQATNHVHANSADPHSSNIDRRLYRDGWFVKTMPDLNQRNSHLSKYLIQNSLWWVSQLGLDGIRMDTYPYSDETFLKEWSCTLKNFFPDLYIVGEEWSLNPVSVSYWQAGSPIASEIGSCLPSVMDFPLQNALSNALNDSIAQDGAYKLYELLATDRVYANPDMLLIFGDNHDMDRLYTQVKRDYQKFELAISFIYTMRGIPQVYYGTEVLLHNDIPGDHGTIREEMPGGWTDHTSNAFKANLNTDQKKAQQFMRSLGMWRKENSHFMLGQFIHFYPENGVYVYFRLTGEEAIMVIHNFSESEQEIKLDRFAEILDNYSSTRMWNDNSIISFENELRISGLKSSIYHLHK